jgi:sulfatase modifying factor 1
LKGPLATGSRLAIALAVSAVACSRETTPVGGLLVAMDLDRSLRGAHLRRLVVDVGSLDGGATYRDASYAIDDAGTPASVRFPTSLGVASNGDSNATVAITLGVWGDTQPVDVERYWVTHVPTTSVAELPVVFGSSCAAPPATSGDGSSCPLARWCRWADDHWLCDASKLPAPGGDSGAAQDWARPLDAGLEAADDGASEGTDDADAGDATLGDEGEPDGDADARGGEGGADAGPLNIPCDAPCGPGRQCVDGNCVSVPPSCAGGGPGAGFDCGGMAGTDDCCASDEVASGALWRDFDGYNFPSKGLPARVSQFRLDRYEVTVGRFREFVNAVSAGDASPAWAPASGAGRHVHLNGGAGLSGGGTGPAIYEAGWDPAWNANLPQTKSDWDTALMRTDCANTSGGYPSDSWTPVAGTDGNENRPITCVSWYEAYAFCIWDDAFLPSDTEWDYAAAGGSNNQYKYAWGDTDPGKNATFAVFECFYPPIPFGNDCTGLQNIAPVGSIAAGVGSWGQLDLTGNVAEWTLDYDDAARPLPCVDCAATSSGTLRRFRGGGWSSNGNELFISVDENDYPIQPRGAVGVRCARVP